jgi:deoxyribodipyrimidine photolyase-related protein
MIKQKNYHLIYPHQLFADVFDLAKNTVLILIEDPLFFGDKQYPQQFHKQKLILHLASMRSFAQKLKEIGFEVHYLEYKLKPTPEYVLDSIKHDANKISLFDPTDFALTQRLKTASEDKKIPLEIIETPNFLTTTIEINKFFAGKNKFSLNSFYQFQRKRLKILVDQNNNPEGGRWSFDIENRKKLPKNLEIPSELHFKHDNFTKAAIENINQNFPNNPGIGENFNYPTTHENAQQLLTDFLKRKFEQFGAYEDAITHENDTALFHSKLSAALNIGLINPQEIVQSALKFAQNNNTPIASVEGFIRQIIGWREFMRAVYILKGVNMRNTNHLKQTKDLNANWYNGTTGITPVDLVINKLIKSAYCHHIERLMILGNFMLLTEVHPQAVYRWFMDMFIDAYDWVMVPNVYAMSQYADGGTITTKPYFSAANYILKMSNYKKNEHWVEIWNALFYNFLEKNKVLISKNPRLNMLIKNLNKLTLAEQKNIQAIAKAQIDKNPNFIGKKV